MKTLLTLLLATLCAATSYGQTVKALSYNTSNGVVAYSGTNEWTFADSITFEAAASVRTNLGLPLQALTNTSNVTTMRALSGSTNTNHPFSGSVSVVGTNNTNTLVFSNGILQAVQ
jgi:hypothetical protein